MQKIVIKMFGYIMILMSVKFLMEFFGWDLFERNPITLLGIKFYWEMFVRSICHLDCRLLNFQVH